MGRSWAYILMVAATLAGAVALLWPSPQVPTIEEIAMPEKAPRAEAPARAPKAAAARPAQGAKAPKAEAPEPAAKRIPPMNTSTRRTEPVVTNGLQQPNFLGKPPGDAKAAADPKAAADAKAPPPKPAGGGLFGRPKPESDRPKYPPWPKKEP